MAALPTSAIIGGLGSLALGYMVIAQVLNFLRGKNTKLERRTHNTFADNPEAYWEQMEKRVTEPLVEVLSRQTQILEALKDDQIRRAAKEEALRDLARGKGAGQ